MTARLYFRLRFLLYLTFREFAVILILQKGFTCEGAMEGIFKRRIKEYIWAGILAFIGASLGVFPRQRISRAKFR